MEYVESCISIARITTLGKMSSFPLVVLLPMALFAGRDGLGRNWELEARLCGGEEKKKKTESFAVARCMRSKVFGYDKETQRQLKKFSPDELRTVPSGL
jgi:hypothetical protein